MLQDTPRQTSSEWKEHHSYCQSEFARLTHHNPEGNLSTGVYSGVKVVQGAHLERRIGCDSYSAWFKLVVAADLTSDRMRSSSGWPFHVPKWCALAFCSGAKPVMDAHSKTQQSTRSNTTVLYVGLAFTSEIAVYSASLVHYKTAPSTACYHSTFTCHGGGLEHEHK